MVQYFYRISDNIFVIYKFSNRGVYPIIEVAAGLAYTNYGEYSKDFLKAKKKYNLESQSLSSWNTAHDRESFLAGIYLATLVGPNKLVIPKRCVEMCEYSYNSWRIKRKKIYDEFERDNAALKTL